jgi:hypothetical protein
MSVLLEKFGVIRYFRELGEEVEVNDCNRRRGGLELSFPNISPEDEKAKTTSLLKGLNKYFREQEVRRIIHPTYDENKQVIKLSYTLPQRENRTIL